MKNQYRTCSVAFKGKVVIEAIKEEQTVAELTQKFELHPHQIIKWKKDFLANSSNVFTSDKQRSEEFRSLKTYRVIFTVKWANSKKLRTTVQKKML